MKFFYILIFAIFFSGCVSTKPTIGLLSLELQPQNVVPSGAKKSLKLSSSSSLNLATMSEINYAQNGAIYQFNHSRWSDTPLNMISKNIVQNLRESGLFGSVLTSKSRSKSDVTLELNIEDFMQYFNENTSYVKLSYSLVLVDNGTNKVISSKYFSTKKDATSLDAMGGAKAYEEALLELLKESRAWLEEVVSGV